ncbi:hypothetical protein DTO166G4_9177 [Paecilomyces variotii]|nr:hypothetical protein DTO166G4_9177 [Paecilomyces variotii]KAJ9227777.1 hypothetical protein DTO166G5_9156 [Paecilomyces variotii]KAJ9244828.1 hypothetical protein DTO169E5_1209 [Paecilomyces variotii]KAJ9247907.1 hypothetical protein DTO195F2_8985 [Paecilomyces variotii]KAJ9257278.1 hypothetical protein DTO207G8_2032 [Paecilomyces variotii]
MILSQLTQELSDLSDSISSLSSDPASICEEEKEAREILSQYCLSYGTDYTAKTIQSFIDFLPALGKRTICRYIIKHPETTSLKELSHHLFAAVLAPMRACGGQNQTVTPSPFGRPDDVAQEMIESSSQNNQQNLKKICLERDNYRCVVTDHYAAECRDKFPDISDEEYDDGMYPTNLSHIIPFALGVYETREQENDVVNIWTTLFALFPDLEDVIKPDLINEPTNTMIMIPILNELWGKLKLAFESTDEEHLYKIKTYPNFPRAALRKRSHGRAEYVRFSKPRGNRTQLPSRILLETHAAIAQIYHASGRAETIDHILEDRESLRQLSADGSTDIQQILPVLIRV